MSGKRLLNKKIIVAIDGFSGTGKSSTAKEVARIVGYKYIDSGAMYRAVTLYFLTHQVNITDKQNVLTALGDIEIDFNVNPTSGQSLILLNGKEVEDKIREKKVTEYVSKVAAISPVRKKLVDLQQQYGREKGIVMDGRDIGTVVFPNAELKIFMTAGDHVRANRRLKELKEKGIPMELKEVLSNLRERDLKDSTRKDSPLVQADDAVKIDTSGLTFTEQVDKIVKLVTERAQ